MYTVSDTDSQLLFALRKGDETAFRILYDRYWADIYTMVYRRLLDEDATKDIVQNIFVNLWISRKEITIESTLAPYLNRAAKNRAISLYKQNEASFARENFFQEEQVQHSIETSLEATELEAFFKEEIDGMPDTMRKAFVLSRHEDKSVREIATELCLSEQTIKNNISQALERLRKRIKLYYSDPQNLTVLFLFFLTEL
ncbi:sigma-70 family RNA polymerase sigma factor [Pedobacter sp. MC2016-15]|uniref:RNA polymerase sigma factor n=1 Tax=Pedobacter sp. MC2016-15 TaxID=2994473 RepID=UPI002247797D|nr:sigma-70 family RNA polymerase sigma factor [Pedobacter sp. MC2016-15]MCX2479733.1 sigma-70 family RNA polymerase sigma factor [Pedobacter sp. MC2016-15]